MGLRSIAGQQSARGILVVLLAVFFGLACLAPWAEAKPQFSAIAVDARTGKVLFSSAPDGPRHPASLTKVMTLYLLFQDLKAGKLKLSSPLKVSARAAGMAPSKLGLKPGSTISVEDAIKALVTKSANDVAAVIGENLGGTESKFAERMTKVARSIGMSRTTFKNASGLPNPGQVTTARDMATLGLRVQRDFPQYYPYFRTMSFKFRGRVIRTHNRLLGRYEGTDGIKTGFINASGFNLSSSVRRGDRRLVGVVMGARSAAGRNAYMMSMLDKAFPKAKGGKTIAAVAGSSKGAIDPTATAENQEQPAKKKTIADLIMKPKEKPPAPVAQESPADSEAAAKLSDMAEQASDQGTDEDAAEGSTFAAVEADASGTPKVLEAKIADTAEPQQELPFEVKKQASQEDVTSSLATAETEGWNIQVGAFASKTDAQKTLLSLKKTQPSLKDRMAYTVTVQKGSATSYKARFSGFSEKDAKSLCGKLAKQKIDCLPVAPQGQGG